MFEKSVVKIDKEVEAKNNPQVEEEEESLEPQNKKKSEVNAKPSS